MAAATNSHVSKYRVIMRSLIDKINNNEFAPDDCLPSEKQLMEEYGVSRITVRRALSEMEAEKYIYRQQGKGTFVNRNRIDENTYRRYNSGFSVIITSSGKKCTIKQIEKEFRPAGSHANQLHLSPEEPCLYYSRVYCADEIPVLYVQSYLNHKCLPGIENYDYNFISLSELVRTVYNAKWYRKDRIIQSTQAGIASPYLDVSKESPVLKLTYVSSIDTQNSLVTFESAELYARTDIISIDSDYI
ncbi:MAG TPA: GntR family transcriptional regulator [Candidatus Blautia excrementipullorum]|nr:GntR family transcriptional regulator [Candidatus Blautia excrementipullorum]